MRKSFIIIAVAIIQVVLTSCHESQLTKNNIVTEPKVTAVRINPVVSCPGCDIVISAFADNGYSGSAPFTVKLGNLIIESGTDNEFELTLPENVSEVFGEEFAARYRTQGYIDVPVEVEVKESGNKTLKFFRIVSQDYEIDDFDVNPILKRVVYDVEGSGLDIDILKYSTVIFTPGYLSGDVTFSVKEIAFEETEDFEVNETTFEDYEFEWIISGNSETLPEMTDLDSKTGETVFSFKDISGAPVVGKFRFTLVVKPKKSYSGTVNGRYGTDFHTFVFDTTGGPVDTE